MRFVPNADLADSFSLYVAGLNYSFDPEASPAFAEKVRGWVAAGLVRVVEPDARGSRLAGEGRVS